MGARTWSLLTLLFRMIPLFLLTRGARKCATPTIPAHEGISRAGSRRFGLTHTASSPEALRPAPEYDRSRRGLLPISSRNRTDLGTGYDRSRGGSGPISARNATDLEPSPPTHPHKVEGAPIRQSRG